MSGATESEADLAWAAALEAWSEGNLPRAFHLCQGVIARGNRDAEVYALMGSIAVGLGQYDRAQEYLRQASARTPAANASGSSRYLVIQPWGCGFWGEVDHVLTQLAVAEITGRIPIVHWGRGAYPAPGHVNAWEAYFEPVSGVRLDDLPATLSVAPSFWNGRSLQRTSLELGRPFDQRTSSLYLLSATEDVIVADCATRLLDVMPWAPVGHWLGQCSAGEAYRRLCQQYLRLAPDMLGEIDRRQATQLARRPVLAVHYRTQTDSKSNESIEHRRLAVEDYFPGIDRFLAAEPKGSVFLMTDFSPCVERMQERYGPRLVAPAATRLDGEGEIEVRLKLGVDLHAAAKEVLVEVHLAARADAFLGDGASGVSCAVGHLRRWPEGRFVLLRENCALALGRIQL